jgi:hypothetical protein
LDEDSSVSIDPFLPRPLGDLSAIPFELTIVKDKP